MEIRRLKFEWTKALLIRFLDFLENIPIHESGRMLQRTIGCRILRAAEAAGFHSAAEITPAWLAELEQKCKKGSRHEAWGRAVFGRFLLAERIWNAAAERTFKERMAAWRKLYGVTESKPALKLSRRRGTSAHQRAMGELVYQLAYLNGLSTGEMQGLRLVDDGVLLENGRLIPFRRGWHYIERETLDTS